MPRRGAEVQYPVFKTIPVYPIHGMVRNESLGETALHQAHDVVNCFVYDNLLRKRPGYGPYPSDMTTLGARIMGVFSTQDEEDNTHILACTPTGVYKLSSGTWTALTGTALTGGTDRPFSFEVSQNSIVFSQGVDVVKQHDISTASTTYITLNANCPAARYLTRGFDRLLLGYTNESGNNKPFRVRRSVVGDHTDWTGVGSGFVDLSEFPYHIRGLRKMGSDVVTYTEKSIHIGRRTGTAASPFSLDLVNDSIGLRSERTLKSAPRLGHLFMGDEDVYAFDGTNPTPLAGPIRDALFGSLAASADRLHFAEFLRDTKEYLLFLVTGSASSPNTIWVLNTAYGIWYRWTTSTAFCSALHRNDDTTTIDDLVGTIDEQTWEFDSRTLQSTFPLMITGHTDGMIHRWGTEYGSDNGVPFTCKWESRDIRSQDIWAGDVPRNLTLRSLAIAYKDTGNSCTLAISFSTDGGTTWDQSQTITLESAGGSGFPEPAILTYQVTGAQIRFKIELTHATQTFQIKRFDLTFEPREAITP